MLATFMEEFNESLPNPRMELLAEIAHAQKAALSEQEFEVMKNRQDVITHSFLKGEISEAESRSEMKKLDVQAGVIKRKGLIQFIDLLRAIGLTENDIRDTVAHENDHMSVALALGVDPVYQIQFLRVRQDGENLQLQLCPSISFDFPEDTSDEEARRILREILEAPEDLSPRDRNQLGHM